MPSSTLPFVDASTVGFLGVGVVAGDILDFAIDKLKAKNIAADLWYKANVIKWDNTGIAAAFRFTKEYLDRLCGAQIFSFRIVGMCLLVAVLTTEATAVISSGKLKLGILDRVEYVAVSGTIDAISLVASRAIVNDNEEEARAFTWSIVMLCIIAYLAMALECAVGAVFLGVLEPQKGIQGVGLGALSVAIMAGLLWPIFILIAQYIIWAMIPGAFTSLVLLVTLSVPFLIVKTRRITRPVIIAVLDRLASMPSWTGRAIGLLCGGVVAILKVNSP